MRVFKPAAQGVVTDPRSHLWCGCIVHGQAATQPQPPPRAMPQRRSKPKTRTQPQPDGGHIPDEAVLRGAKSGSLELIKEQSEQPSPQVSHSLNAAAAAAAELLLSYTTKHVTRLYTRAASRPRASGPRPP